MNDWLETASHGFEHFEHIEHVAGLVRVVRENFTDKSLNEGYQRDKIASWSAR